MGQKRIDGVTYEAPLVLAEAYMSPDDIEVHKLAARQRSEIIGLMSEKIRELGGDPDSIWDEWFRRNGQPVIAA
ncbi:hypothetical protein SAMN05216466_10793 [Paraburkholderia phenazinium]|uniref:Uncharacterized protein n=1 Tax=Paraburkholderia phenazinium TaxID=60549 RepID=A0A1G7ZP82_9BURK|nr:hypothetical protein [Paraburkholderia phenazinium]SDH09910.1 hypothetical protein SAMN05216466_10793 [Paraburkholderia phenazinium]